MARIELRHVSKRFLTGHAAVADLSLDIPDGEFVVIVGPSGCGKTTLLRMIAGLESPTSGSIRLGDRDITHVPPADRDIAMVFQNYALYPHMTVRQNLAFALRVRRTPRREIETRVRDVADLMDLTSMLDHRPSQLSGGQRQRVAVGRAIIREPAAFLFDEPLSNLDALLRARMRQELKALHQRLRTTALYVTHDQEEAMSLADRVVVMASGKIQQAGPPMTIFNQPANRFVASFIGTPPMNLLEGTLHLGPSGPRFVREGPAGRLDIPLQADAVSTVAHDAPVTLGVRPTDFEFATLDAQPSIPLRCNLIERFGAHADLTCSAPDGSTILVRTERADVREGETLRVRARTCHSFAPGPFGVALRPTPAHPGHALAKDVGGAGLEPATPRM